MLIQRSKQVTDIPITTADTLPPALGGSREVKRMRVIKYTGYSHPGAAQNKLIARAQELGYDAVIGVHFLAYPEVYAPAYGIGSAPITTEIRWAVYGTAIGW
jgi:uncharacterized protein YbjQ (UPF0145 family)